MNMNVRYPLSLLLAAGISLARTRNLGIVPDSPPRRTRRQPRPDCGLLAMPQLAPRRSGHQIAACVDGELRCSVQAHFDGAWRCAWLQDPVELELILVAIELEIDAGVDGIFTDRPDTLKSVLKRRGLWSEATP